MGKQLGFGVAPRPRAMKKAVLQISMKKIQAAPKKSKLAPASAKKAKALTLGKHSLYTGTPGELPPKYEKIVLSLDTPTKIQAFLDKLPYDPTNNMCSVIQTLESGIAHCFGGAIFAAYCLGRHGYGSRIVGMAADYKIDDGHELAVYQKDGLWGAISKSNYNGLRGRDPVYASLRELVMSYFEFHIAPGGEKSLRSWSDALWLDEVDKKREWVFRKDIPSGSKKAEKASTPCPHKCLPKGFKIQTDLAKMTGKTLKAQLLGINKKGQFKGGN